MIKSLEYFLPSDLNRTLLAADGGLLTYYKKGNLVYAVLSNVAWSESAMWVRFRLRKKWICLEADTGNAIPGVRYYTFNPGFWMPYEVEVGWAKYFQSNISTWYGTPGSQASAKEKANVAVPSITVFSRHASLRDEPHGLLPNNPGDGCDLLTRHPGPYRNTLLSHEERDLGGDLGVVDTITLEYHTGGETHTYGKHPTLGGLGLVQWWAPGFPLGTFNRIKHKPCTMLPVCGSF